MCGQDVKNDLSDIIIEFISPIQNEYAKILKDKSYLTNILNEGAIYAKYEARKTLSKVYRKIGFIN